MTFLRSGLVLGVLAACGGSSGGGGDGGVSTLLTVTPAMATVALVPAAGGYAATQTFAVSSTGPDGKVTDVTAKVAWLADDPAVTFDHGVATITAAGPYALVAQYGGQTAPAELTATLADQGVGTGFPPGGQPILDGTPTAGAAPTIAYPLAGALFPVNVAPIEIHAQKADPRQTLARIELTSGTQLAYRYYAPCAASPNPGTFPGACIVSISGTFASQLAGVSEAADVQLKVRLAAADGSLLGESAPTALAWSRVGLTGGLYYWTTAGAGEAFNTAIARYDFNGDASRPTIYLSDNAAPAVPAGQTQCLGCHAVSPDGAKLAFSLGGSDPSFFSLYDVATAMPTASNLTASKFAGMSTFSPDGSRMVTMSYGNLTLRTADASLGVIQDHLFADAISTERLSHPFWSPGGSHFAFVSWTPSAADVSANHITGDMVQGAQIWIADSDGTAMTSTPRVLVPRAANITSYYPAISDDDRFVVFNQSDCTGPANGGAWGAGACDGYNDISATLHVVPVAGGAPIALTRANGGDAPLTTNSWPRWSPDHGTFRGKRLYWVAFSSRRAYGLVLSGTNIDRKPQLWFAAVAVSDDGSAPTVDPSFAPVWLPGQDPDPTGPRGNHTPAWTSKIVVIE